MLEPCRRPQPRAGGGAASRRVGSNPDAGRVATTWSYVGARAPRASSRASGRRRAWRAGRADRGDTSWAAIASTSAAYPPKPLIRLGARSPPTRARAAVAGSRFGASGGAARFHRRHGADARASAPRSRPTILGDCAIRDELGVDVYLGDGALHRPSTRVEVEGADALRFARAVIATGARAAAPPDLRDSPRSRDILTNESVFGSHRGAPRDSP